MYKIYTYYGIIFIYLCCVVFHRFNSLTSLHFTTPRLLQRYLERRCLGCKDVEAVNAIGVQHTAALIEAAEPRWSNEKSAASATSLHVRLRNRYEICFFILFPTTASLTQGVWTLFWAIRPNTLQFLYRHASSCRLDAIEAGFLQRSQFPSWPITLPLCPFNSKRPERNLPSLVLKLLLYCFPAPFFEPSGESNVNVGWSWWSIWNAGEAQQTLEIGGIWHLGLIYHEITFSHQVKCPRGWSKDARCDDMVWRQNWATITFQKRSEYIGMIKGKVVSLFLKASLCLFLNSTMEPNCPGFLPRDLEDCLPVSLLSAAVAKPFMPTLTACLYIHAMMACMNPAINLSHSTHVFVEFHQ